ncbi:hypothetical protein LJY25_16445 [Hymenobacter sp. BT175]|uniref:hypothetical protein n=1 Tax=Hymenobacter translucens TaxID=2886507 RepID=UPI001D0E0558|nr:hypothetical protein [Hymenobacter translucens]MCC2548040.1 hypothetical protein [Hymenobacter translucens]
MLRLLYLLALLLLLTPKSHGKEKYTDLVAAVKGGDVRVSAVVAATLGSTNNVRCQLKNLTSRSLSLRVPPGLHFGSEPSAQDLLTWQPQQLVIAPGAEQAISLQGFCLEAADHAPAQNAGLAFIGYAKPALKSLADSLAKYPVIAADYGQSLVWALTDKRPLWEDLAVAPELERAARNVSRFLSAQTGQPAVAVVRSRPGYRRMAPEIFSKKVTMLYQNHAAQPVTLVLLDSAGRELRTFFRNRPAPTGVLRYTFGVNEVVRPGKRPLYFLKLLGPGNQLLSQLRVDATTSEAEPVLRVRRFTYQFKLTRPVRNVRVTVRLADGTLVKEFPREGSLPAGPAEFQLGFDHTYPPETAFFAQLEGANGVVYNRQPVPDKK